MKKVKFVSIDDKHLAHLYDRPGDSFRLADVIAPHPMMGGDAFTELYFRTQSGNIYHIVQERGEFGRKAGFVLRNARAKQDVPLDVQRLNDAEIEIGASFNYGSGGTTPVVEIVPVNGSRCYVPQYLAKVTTDTKCPIRKDFDSLIQSS